MQGRIFLHHHQADIKALEIPRQPPGERTKYLSSGLLTSCQGRDCSSAEGTQAGCESRWKTKVENESATCAGFSHMINQEGKGVL